MGKGDIFKNSRIEDVRWLCSLSESELDMLISLKMVVIQRARRIKHEALSTKFDLKMLRVLGFVVMEYLKGQLKDFSAIPALAESSASLDGCNLLKHTIDGSFGTMSIEELWVYIGTDKRKRIAELFGDDLVPKQKKRTDTERSL